MSPGVGFASCPIRCERARALGRGEGHGRPAVPRSGANRRTRTGSRASARTRPTKARIAAAAQLPPRPHRRTDNRVAVATPPARTPPKPGLPAPSVVAHRRRNIRSRIGPAARVGAGLSPRKRRAKPKMHRSGKAQPRGGPATKKLVAVGGDGTGPRRFRAAPPAQPFPMLLPFPLSNLMQATPIFQHRIRRGSAGQRGCRCRRDGRSNRRSSLTGLGDPIGHMVRPKMCMPISISAPPPASRSRTTKSRRRYTPPQRAAGRML